jgi:hypothetical protein
MTTQPRWHIALQIDMFSLFSFVAPVGGTFFTTLNKGT